MKNKLLLSMIIFTLGVQSSALLAMDQQCISLIANDGTTFYVTKNIACVSETIRTVIQPMDGIEFLEGTSNTINLPLNGAALSAMIHMMEKYAEQQEQNNALFESFNKNGALKRLALQNPSAVAYAIEYAQCKEQESFEERKIELAATLQGDLRLGHLLEEASFLNLPNIIKRAIALAYWAKSGY